MPCYRATPTTLVRETLPIAVLLSTLFIQPASAYVDPSTGSYMLQLAMGFLFTAIFTIKAFFKRISTKRMKRHK
ncbi:MAG: hypothetical protein C0469_11270 [Cyanobacteria bacterium DS2.3.42]|nr:hypothetical protein [Cyanobacteria bacterium DS2.3.42]